MKAEEHLVGAVVVIAVLLAAILGVFLVFQQPYGRAFQGLDQTECSCRLDGYQFSAIYDDGFVLMPGGDIKSVEKVEESADTCDQVCAMVGGYKQHL